MKRIIALSLALIMLFSLTASALTNKKDPLTLKRTAPVINNTLPDVKTNASFAVDLTVEATGLDLHYEWNLALYNGVRKPVFKVVGEDSPKIEFSPELINGKVRDISYLDGAKLYCRVYNAYGEAKTNTITFEIISAPTITEQPQNLTVHEGHPVEFYFGVNGEEVHYTWTVYKGDESETYNENGGAVDGGYFHLTENAVYDMHNGIKVQCYAWNGDGEVVSDMVTLTVIKYPNAGQPDHMPEVSDFTDVPANAWYYNDVANAVEMGLINGTSTTSYSPNDDLTIGAAIKLAACMHQKYHTGAVTLKNGTVNWYDTYVEYAEKNGIIYRDEWDEAYNKKATRQEFVTIFYKALPHTEYPEINDIDANAIPDVPMDIGYASVVYGFYRAGILTGSDANGTFYPNRNIQRSEVATIISRMMDKSARKFIVLPAIDLGLMKGPMCWISGNKYVFITEREGKAAVQFGYWESPYYPTRPVAFVSAVGVNGNFMDIDLYYPPLSGDNAADSQDLQPGYETIHIDMEYLDVDGKVKMRWNNETEWSHYYPAGPTWQDGYNEVH